MSVELTNRSGALVPEKQMHSLLDFGITYMELHPDCAISLTFVDVTEMEELHIKWMDESGPTDVLSFPMDLPEHDGEIVTLGDIVIAPAVAAKQAKPSTPRPSQESALEKIVRIYVYIHYTAFSRIPKNKI